MRVSNLHLQFAGEKQLLDCLERNERSGIVYHREGVDGDYDDFENVEDLFLQENDRF